MLSRDVGFYVGATINMDHSSHEFGGSDLWCLGLGLARLLEETGISMVQD